MTPAEKKAFVARMKSARAVARKTHRPPQKAKKAKSGRGRRRNPDDMPAAEQMYERFHGRPAQRTVEHLERLAFRDTFAELGKLLELRFRLDGIRQPVPLVEFKGAQVACTPDGENIYFLGGNQSVDLSSLDIESDKDYVELGECTYIKYLAKKGFHDFEPIEYFHEFGEEDGIRPVLAYDSQNQKLFLLGGNYRCKPEGITN
jgi:hypothetical protein